MNRAVYCINCEYSEPRGISPEQTEKGYGQNENNRKRGSPEKKRSGHRQKSVTPTTRKTTNNREEQPREKHGRRRDDEWTETCPASTTVHGPAQNGKEWTIVGGTHRVISDANMGNSNPESVSFGREWLLGNRYTRISPKCGSQLLGQQKTGFDHREDHFFERPLFGRDSTRRDRIAPWITRNSVARTTKKWIWSSEGPLFRTTTFRTWYH